MTSHMYKQSVKRGACYLFGSAAVFSLVGVMVKILTADLPLEMVVFFRSAAGLVFLTPWILINRNISLKTSHLLNHVQRAVAGVLAMYCFFYTISKLNLAEAITLNFTSPLIIPIVAYFMLKERLPRMMGVLLVIGFAGVLLIVRPGDGIMKNAALVGAMSAVFAAFALVNIRKLTRTEPAIRVVYYFALIATVLTTIPMLRVWETPAPFHWLFIAGMGLCATTGQWLLTRGYASAPAGQVGYFQYSAVIFAGMMDWIIWSSRPDWISLFGVCLICGAGIFASRTVSAPPPARAV